MKIPYGKQNLSKNDINAVITVLKSEFLTQGPLTHEFEKSISNYCGVKYGVATNSATSALHIACLALDVGPGDIVWTSPISFVASANCALFCGAKIDFVDIDSLTFNMSINALKDKLSQAEKNGTLPKVIIPVHFAGQSCEMSEIYKLSEKYKFKIIEDASHAIGGKYKDIPIGSCKYSDITIFSFHPVKIITTGEGGMAMTNNDEVFQRMSRLRSHGITRDPGEMVGKIEGAWLYQQLDLGFNYRMSDMEAALGLSQLTRLDEFVSTRNALAINYDHLLSSMTGLIPQKILNVCKSSYHLYTVRIDHEKASSTPNRNQIFERLRLNGIGANVHYIPIYRHPYYKNLGFVANNYPESEKYYSETLTLPLYPGLTKKQQKLIIDIASKPIHHQTLF